MSEHMPEHMPEHMSDHMSEHMSNHMSKHMSEHISKHMSKHMSEHMSKPMSKPMSKHPSDPRHVDAAAQAAPAQPLARQAVHAAVQPTELRTHRLGAVLRVHPHAAGAY